MATHLGCHGEVIHQAFFEPARTFRVSKAPEIRRSDCVLPRREKQEGSRRMEQIKTVFSMSSVYLIVHTHA